MERWRERPSRPNDPAGRAAGWVRLQIAPSTRKDPLVRSGGSARIQGRLSMAVHVRRHESDDRFGAAGNHSGSGACTEGGAVTFRDRLMRLRRKRDKRKTGPVSLE